MMMLCDVFIYPHCRHPGSFAQESINTLLLPTIRLILFAWGGGSASRCSDIIALILLGLVASVFLSVRCFPQRLVRPGGHLLGSVMTGTQGVERTCVGWSAWLLAATLSENNVRCILVGIAQASCFPLYKTRSMIVWGSSQVRKIDIHIALGWF